jgi:hypothetical protein
MIRATNEMRLIMRPPNTMDCLRHYPGRCNRIERKYRRTLAPVFGPSLTAP